MSHILMLKKFIEMLVLSDAEVIKCINAAGKWCAPDSAYFRMNTRSCFKGLTFCYKPLAGLSYINKSKNNPLFHIFFPKKLESDCACLFELTEAQSSMIIWEESKKPSGIKDIFFVSASILWNNITAVIQLVPNLLAFYGVLETLLFL